MKRYNFSWDQLGDIQLGRPNLGSTANIAVYRLMQYTMREVLEEEYGDEVTSQLLVKAGRVAGKEFCKNLLDITLPVNKFISQLHQVFIELGVGILQVEESDTENMNFTVTVSEDLDCSGLPLKGVAVCEYDEGLIEGIFNVYTGKEFNVKEVDCWTTGERTCRFEINQRKNA